MYLYKKRPKNGGKFTFIWVAVDRNTGKVIDFEVGDRSKEIYIRLALRRSILLNIYVLMITVFINIIKYQSIITLQSQKHHCWNQLIHC